MEAEVKRLPLFPAFLLDMGNSEDHVNGGSSGPEATRGLGIDVGCQCLLPCEQNADKDIPDDAHQ